MLENEIQLFATMLSLMKAFPKPKNDDWAKIIKGLEYYYENYKKIGLEEFYSEIMTATVHELERRAKNG